MVIFPDRSGRFEEGNMETTENEGRIFHINWDDREQVEAEISNLLTTLPHLEDSAAAEGSSCPQCGHSPSEIKEVNKKHRQHLESRHCPACALNYTRYDMKIEPDEKWGPTWRQSTVVFHIEDYPYYIYFKPQTHVLEGLGPNLLPWEN